MYENYIKWLNYKLQELIIAERMRSIGEGNVENQVPYRCHIICHMNRFMDNLRKFFAAAGALS